MDIKSYTEDPPPVEQIRVVELRLPESRAQLLAETIDRHIDWHATLVEDELWALHNALKDDLN